MGDIPQHRKLAEMPCRGPSSCSRLNDSVQIFFIRWHNVGWFSLALIIPNWSLFSPSLQMIFWEWRVNSILLFWGWRLWEWIRGDGDGQNFEIWSEFCSLSSDFYPISYFNAFSINKGICPFLGFDSLPQDFSPHIYDFRFYNNTTFSFFSEDFTSSGEIFIAFYSFAMHEAPFFILIEYHCNSPCCICNLPFTPCDFLYIDNSFLGPFGIHVSLNNCLFLVISHFTHPLLLWIFRRMFLSLSAYILIGPKLSSHFYSDKAGNS